jgi:hypothetical protein
MARQMKQQPKRDAINGRPHVGPPTEEPKRRRTVEELMAMSETEIRGWMRHVGLRTLSELSADERRTD